MLRPMELTVEDRLAIYELVAHGHLDGARAFVEASVALGDDNPLGHHLTNALVTGGADNEATVRSKGIGTLANGKSGTVVYEDVVRRTDAGPPFPPAQPSSYVACGAVSSAATARRPQTPPGRTAMAMMTHTITA